MPLNINTNTAASSASYYLSKNNAALQKSLTRLSSGSRITQPADDAGGLAVSMKLSGTINRLNGVEKNIDNAISFLQVQDGGHGHGSMPSARRNASCRRRGEARERVPGGGWGWCSRDCDGGDG